MDDLAASPGKNPSAARSGRPRLTSRGGALLAISTLAVMVGLFTPEARLVHLGLLGLLVLGGGFFWSGLNLRTLSHARITPESAFAGQLFPLTLTVTNHRQLLDAVAVEFEDSVAGPIEKGLGIDWLQAGGSATREMQSRLLKRGIVHPTQSSVESSFPFGLWMSRIELSGTLEMTIFPRPVPPRLFDYPHLITLLEANEAESAVAGWEGDFHGLREFQPGDRLKLIHWPTSARSRHLVVRQFDRRPPSRVTLVFHSIRPDQKPQPGDVFESALELLCGMLHQLNVRGMQADLIASFNQWQKLPVDSPESLTAALRTLATAKRKAERNCSALHDALADTEAGDRVIVLSDVPLKEWEGDLPEMPCVTICLSVSELYVRQPRMRPKAPPPGVPA